MRSVETPPHPSPLPASGEKERTSVAIIVQVTLVRREGDQHDLKTSAHHGRRQLPAAGLAGRPRPAVQGRGARAPRSLARERALVGAGAGRCDAACDPRHGARRHRHHHRWRGAPGKLFQPFCDRARRHCIRQAGRGGLEGGRCHRGAARGRSDPPHACGRNPRHGIPAPKHRADGEDHAAGSVHDEPAGGQRILQRRRRDGDGLRRRRECPKAPAPISKRPAPT